MLSHKSTHSALHSADGWPKKVTVSMQAEEENKILDSIKQKRKEKNKKKKERPTNRLVDLERHYRSIIQLIKPKPKEEDAYAEYKNPRIYDNLFQIMIKKRISYYVGTKCMKRIEKEDCGEDKPLVMIPHIGFYSFSTLLIPLELGLRLIVNDLKEWPLEFESPLLTPMIQKATKTERTKLPAGNKVYFTWKDTPMICELLVEADESGAGSRGHLTLCLQSED